MIFAGDMVKLTKPICDFDRVGNIFLVETIAADNTPSASKNIVKLSCSYGNGFISAEWLQEHFIKVTTHPWSSWKHVLIGNCVYQYRTNGKRVTLRLGGLKASASCHPMDSFSLEEGIKICAERIAAKAALKEDTHGN